jgi:hypothetical protein
VHPDIVASGELLVSLRERAGRAGLGPSAFQGWLEARQLPRTGDGDPILSVQERSQLITAFNEALAALKASQPAASKARPGPAGPADGDAPRLVSGRDQPPRSGRSGRRGGRS